MLNEKAINGLLRATPEKRYKSFLNTVTDLEEVFVGFTPGENVFATDNNGLTLLWSHEEICELMLSSNQIPRSIEIHDFLEYCKSIDGSSMFSVFPTSESSYIVSAKQLILDIQEHLDELE